MARPTKTAAEVAFGQRLGKALRRARDAKGLSALDLSRRSQVSLDAIRSVEGGRVASPGFALVARLATHLELDLNTLAKRARRSR